MKRLLPLILGFCCLATECFSAPQITYLDEVKQLGAVSGQGLGCRARKYQQYELLARALLVTKSPNDKLQQQAMRVYNEAKVDAYMTVFANDYAGCDEIVYNFNRQKIFKMILYADGKIKLLDGSVLKPRKPCDASSLYKKDPDVYAKAYDSYKKALAIAEKNRQNAPKLELRDANYNKYANQFN